MRTTALGLLVAMAAACGTSPEYGADMDAVGHALRSTWYLTVEAEGRMTAGSGFPIAVEPEGAGWRVTILTAGHLVDGAEPEADFGAVLDNAEEETLEGGRLLRRHPEVDLALLSFVSPTYVAPIPLSDRTLGLGEDVWLAGWQGGRHRWLTRGVAQEDARRVTAQSWLGSSGGPVFDSAGQAVAVYTATGFDRPRYTPHPVLFPHQSYVVHLAHFIGWMGL